MTALAICLIVFFALVIAMVFNSYLELLEGFLAIAVSVAFIVAIAIVML